LDADMTDLLTAADYPSLSPAMLDWLMTGDSQEIAEQYCESFKDAHGIKARWMLGAVHTPAEWARMFVQLGHDIDESIEQDKARDAAFLARVESLGLAQWAKDNNIKSELDLWEHNYRKENEEA
jgi:hypothetical protein